MDSGYLVCASPPTVLYLLDSDRGPIPHRGPVSTTGANLIPHRGPILIVPQRGPIRGNVKILRDDVVRFTALPMMTLKINVIIKMVTSTEIRAVLNIKEMGLLLESKGTNFKYFHKLQYVHELAVLLNTEKTTKPLFVTL